MEGKLSIRIDKWLWAARFFKTRELAAKACDQGKVELGGSRAKPAREVHAGHQLRIETPGGIFEVEVLGIAKQRGSAAVAQTLYRESDASVETRRAVAEENRLRRLYEPAPIAPPKRPSKRDRRLIHSFSGRGR
ncbi:MAG TPA: RNA-binding S4 domain-containing protein [Acidobacteriaceae bacterium]|nr:RNA-binding S4 domain-containing protein [Acidobacteriaceae bacterium]